MSCDTALTHNTMETNENLLKKAIHYRRMLHITAFHSFAKENLLLWKLYMSCHLSFWSELSPPDLYAFDIVPANWK